jgi:drug/metabolite transporter (DMT)-like permease
MSFGNSPAFVSQEVMHGCRNQEVPSAEWALARKHWLDFVFIGMCEGLYLLAVFTAVAKLPGPMLPVIAQMLLVWNIILSAIILEKR